MRELMLKLLTYEPFEVTSGDEKTYIDAVLAGDTNVAQSFALYDELHCICRNYFRKMYGTI